MPERHIEMLFASKHGLGRSVLKELDQTDLENIREMVLGLRPSPDRGRAMDILVAAGAPDAHSALGEVLLNPEEDDLLRASAASYLGRLGGPEAEGILLASVSTPTELIVRAKIAAALGRTGSVRSMAALQELANDVEEAVRSQASFSLSVIAYRDGLQGFDLTVPEPSEMIALDPSRAKPFEIRAAQLEEVGGAVDWLARKPYGLELAEQNLHLIEYGEVRMVLALDARLLEGDLAAGLCVRHMLMGLIASRAPVEDSYSTQRLLFTWPAGDDQFYMAIHSTDGTQIMFGSGTTDGKTAEFELGALRRRGSAAVTLRGRVEGSTLTFFDAFTATTRERMAVPERLGPPSFPEL